MVYKVNSGFGIKILATACLVTISVLTTSFGISLGKTLGINSAVKESVENPYVFNLRQEIYKKEKELNSIESFVSINSSTKIIPSRFNQKQVKNADK